MVTCDSGDVITRIHVDVDGEVRDVDSLVLCVRGHSARGNRMGEGSDIERHVRRPWCIDVSKVHVAVRGPIDTNGVPTIAVPITSEHDIPGITEYEFRRSLLARRVVREVYAAR